MGVTPLVGVTPWWIPTQVRPLKNMMEYAGIEAARIEAMEERLKKDVVAEVRQTL